MADLNVVFHLPASIQHWLSICGAQTKKIWSETRHLDPNSELDIIDSVAGIHKHDHSLARHRHAEHFANLSGRILELLQCKFSDTGKIDNEATGGGTDILKMFQLGVCRKSYKPGSAQSPRTWSYMSLNPKLPPTALSNTASSTNVCDTVCDVHVCVGVCVT